MKKRTAEVVIDLVTSPIREIKPRRSQYDEKIESNAVSELNQLSSSPNQVSCPRCTYINSGSLSVCEVCSAPLEITLSTAFNTFIECNTPDTIGVSGILESVGQRLKFVTLCSPQPYHFTQQKLFGSRWSCGYRNVQTLLSSLMQTEPFRSALFDGKGRIPSIREIQMAIEASWLAGFDVEVRISENYPRQIVISIKFLRALLIFLTN